MRSSLSLSCIGLLAARCMDQCCNSSEGEPPAGKHTTCSIRETQGREHLVTAAARQEPAEQLCAFSPFSWAEHTIALMSRMHPACFSCLLSKIDYCQMMQQACITILDRRALVSVKDIPSIHNQVAEVWGEKRAFVLS